MASVSPPSSDTTAPAAGDVGVRQRKSVLRAKELPLADDDSSNSDDSSALIETASPTAYTVAANANPPTALSTPVVRIVRGAGARGQLPPMPPDPRRAPAATTAADTGAGGDASYGELALLLLFAVAVVAGGAVWLASIYASNTSSPLRLFDLLGIQPEHGLPAHHPLHPNNQHHHAHAHARHARKMQDTHIRLSVPLESLVRGEVVQANLPDGRQSLCGHCHGNGVENGAPAATCPACMGSGRTEGGWHHGRRQQHQCALCKGRGLMVHSVCPYCRGEGVMRSRASVGVPLAPGTPEGFVLTLQEAGDVSPRTHKHAESFGGAGVAPGDVVVTVTSRAHDRFERRGADLLTEARVGLLEALNGLHDSTIHLLDGSTLPLREGLVATEGGGDEPGATTAVGDVVQPGQVLVFPSRGMPRFEGVAVVDPPGASSLSAGQQQQDSSSLGFWDRSVRGVRKLLAAVGVNVPTMMAAIGGPQSQARAADSSSTAKQNAVPAGDLYVTIRVDWPRGGGGSQFTDEQKDALRRLLP